MNRSNQFGYKLRLGLFSIINLIYLLFGISALTFIVKYDKIDCDEVLKLIIIGCIFNFIVPLFSFIFILLTFYIYKVNYYAIYSDKDRYDIQGYGMKIIQCLPLIIGFLITIKYNTMDLKCYEYWILDAPKIMNFITFHMCTMTLLTVGLIFNIMYCCKNKYYNSRHRVNVLV